MKISILFPYVQGPYGGSNQFMKGLRDSFQRTGLYVPDPGDSDVVLFDSFRNAEAVLRTKSLFPGKKFVHRLDGPISAYRGGDIVLDRFIHVLNDAIADGTVYQSMYSMKMNAELGKSDSSLSTIIRNAPLSDCFYAPASRPASRGGKIKIVAMSWSSNMNKGFSVYRFLDGALDFNRYEMTFVGNSPVRFNNIRMRAPLESRALGGLLREHDLYLTASLHDPCSNSLLEALACGLPAVAIESGGHPELVKEAGVLFKGTEDAIGAINKVAENLDYYRELISVRSIDDITREYCDFFEKVLTQPAPPKRLGLRSRGLVLYYQTISKYGLRLMHLPESLFRSVGPVV